MCKSVFVHDWRTQGIRVAEGAAMIRHNARYFSLFSPIREKSGLDAVAGSVHQYIYIPFSMEPARWPNAPPTQRPAPSRSTAA